MPTPDPSASVTAWQAYVAARDAYAAGLVVDGLDLIRLLIFALVLVGGVIAAMGTGQLVAAMRRG